LLNYFQGICDGAGAVVIASEEAVKKHNLTPLARLVGYSVAGVDPTIMGIGPVYAIRDLLQKVNLSLDNIDLVEVCSFEQCPYIGQILLISQVNEAFAAQFLAVEKELGLDRNKTNLNGGAIALGHPLAASGSRITAHLVHELRRKSLKYAMGSACIGGGQGIAVLLERV
jgi:acetyl-CoA acyltransferase 2